MNVLLFMWKCQILCMKISYCVKEFDGSWESVNIVQNEICKRTHLMHENYSGKIVFFNVNWMTTKWSIDFINFKNENFPFHIHIYGNPFPLKLRFPKTASIDICLSFTFFVVYEMCTQQCAMFAFFATKCKISYQLLCNLDNHSQAK